MSMVSKAEARTVASYRVAIPTCHMLYARTSKTLCHHILLYAVAYYPILILFAVLARNMIIEIDHPSCGPIKMVNTPIKYSESETSIQTPPPTLGQHTDEILREFVGMTTAEIKVLRAQGIVA